MVNCVQRFTRALLAVAVAACMLVFGGGRCIKEHRRTAKITVEKQGDLSNLAVVTVDNNYLLGIDTSTFQVEARINCKGMEFDKALRLADGAVLVVNDSDGAPPELHIFDTDCSERTSATAPSASVTPFIHGNLIFIGNRYFGPGGAQVAIYRLDDMSHQKTLGVKGQLLREENFSGVGEYVFFPYDGSMAYPTPIPSHVVMLNTRTLDTVHLHMGDPLSGDNSDTFASAASGDTLVVLPFSGCRPIVYSIAERRVLAYENLNKEIESRTGTSDGVVSRPIVQNGMLYMLYAWNKQRIRTIYWVKIRLSDLSLVDAKQVVHDKGEWFAGDDFLTFGRFYVIEGNLFADKIFTATFVDWRTGEVAGQCTLNDVQYPYSRIF